MARDRKYGYRLKAGVHLYTTPGGKKGRAVAGEIFYVGKKADVAELVVEGRVVPLEYEQEQEKAKTVAAKAAAKSKGFVGKEDETEGEEITEEEEKGDETKPGDEDK